MSQQTDLEALSMVHLKTLAVHSGLDMNLDWAEQGSPGGNQAGVGQDAIITKMIALGVNADVVMHGE